MQLGVQQCYWGPRLRVQQAQAQAAAHSLQNQMRGLKVVMPGCCQSLQVARLNDQQGLEHQ